MKHKLQLIIATEFPQAYILRVERGLLYSVPGEVVLHTSGAAMPGWEQEFALFHQFAPLTLGSLHGKYRVVAEGQYVGL